MYSELHIYFIFKSESIKQKWLGKLLIYKVELFLLIIEIQLEDT